MISGVDGDEIRRRREARGLTQQELAAKIGVGLRTIGNWERGESVPKNRMGMLREFFGMNEADQSTDPRPRSPSSPSFSAAPATGNGVALRADANAITFDRVTSQPSP